MSLSKLESKKVLLEFQHTKEELILKKEMISEINPIFNQAINEYLSTDAQTKEQWNAYHNITDDEPISDTVDMVKFDGDPSEPDVTPEPEPEPFNDPIEPEPEPNPEEDVESEHESDPFASVYKMVYREIVKRSHPDKVSHLPEEERDERCKIYVDATKAYEKKDIGELIFYAHQLKVPLTMDKNELMFLRTTVGKYKKESALLEQTYSWKWFYATDDEKRMLVERFIHAVLTEK